jgi:arabinogalactan oligomer/maltooligosaccharide transport system permease protein
MRRISTSRQILSQGSFILAGLFVIIPIWGILRLAFDGSLTSRPTEFRLFPKDFTLAPLARAWEDPYQTVTFPDLLRNSIVVGLGAALVAVILGASLAYGFARFRFPGHQTGLFVLLLAALLPLIAFATPMYVLLSALHVRTSLLALIIVYAAFAMPFCIWNMRSAFQAVPNELEEAAFLDGAGNFTSFLRITLPLAIPSIAVAALIAFLMAYSEFTIGWLFVDRAANVTLAMAIYATLASGSIQPWSITGSLMLMMSIPVVIIFLVMQRTLLDRWLFGSVSA